MEFDIIETVSELISNIEQYNILELDEKLKNTDIKEWSDDAEKLRLLIKLGYLINEIRNEGTLSLYQLIKGKNKYFVHPGTTRILISTYLLPEKTIKGFYLWNEQFDDRPFIIDYHHKEIKNWFDLLTLSSFKYPSRFKYIMLTEKTDCNDVDSLSIKSNRPFLFAQKQFSSILNQYEIPFLTFHNSTHWKNINKKILFSDVIKFINDKECVLSGIKFKKYDNGLWIKE